MHKKSALRTCVFFTVVVLLLSNHFADCRPQFWSRFRETIFGRPSTENNAGDSQQSEQQSQCDKGESYSPDKCNVCRCVGKSYRCTLKYCDESLANLPAFQLD